MGKDSKRPTLKQQWKAMHPDLAAQADTVIERHKARPFMPPMAADKDFAFVPPYQNGKDQERWWALFFDALGTRQQAVVTMFIRQMEGLIDSRFNNEWGQWVSDEEQMIAGFAFLQSLKPRNIAEAALAAQLYALHLSTMKIGRDLGKRSHGDARTVATLARSVRAYGDGLMTMRKLKGKGARTVQVIKVQTHRHNHQHIHLEGSGKNGGQAQAKAAAVITELRSLSGQSPHGDALSIASGEGQACMPDARSGSRDGGAEG